MKLLAFETATAACSVALWIDGKVMERCEIAPRRHAELVLPWADALLAEAGSAKSTLDVIACGRGPGAFTGVRLAIALAQGIALALDRPIVAVSTLAALAMQAPRAGCVLSAIDARMNEIYFAPFRLDDGGLAEPLAEERLLSTEAVAELEGSDWMAVGNGWCAGQGVFRDRFASHLASVDTEAIPHASAVARLAARDFTRGLARPPEAVEPAYLRNKVALTLKEQRRLR